MDKTFFKKIPIISGVAILEISNSSKSNKTRKKSIFLFLNVLVREILNSRVSQTLEERKNLALSSPKKLHSAYYRLL